MTRGDATPKSDIDLLVDHMPGEETSFLGSPALQRNWADSWEPASTWRPHRCWGARFLRLLRRLGGPCDPLRLTQSGSPTSSLRSIDARATSSTSVPTSLDRWRIDGARRARQPRSHRGRGSNPPARDPGRHARCSHLQRCSRCSAWLNQISWSCLRGGASRTDQLGRFLGDIDPTNVRSSSTASPRASSIPARISSDSNRPAASALSLTCSGREPPVIADATLSFCITQAIAIWAIVRFRCRRESRVVGRG